MRIGQLARLTGVSPDTLRYYERIGLMPKPHRAASGYRDYSDGAVNRVRIIRNAVHLGFPLHEIAKVLKVRDEGGAPCRQVRDYATSLIERMEQRINELTVERNTMLAMLRTWDQKLTVAGSAPARLLESLPPSPSGIRAKHARLRRFK